MSGGGDIAAFEFLDARIGELLFGERRLGGGRSIAIFAIVVDAKDERGANFYKAFGFEPFPLQPRRLFLPTATAVAALSKL
ncbi:MAG: hypothetical protein ACREQB_03400 [Candidatus Binataceae bacterium]